MLKRKKTLWRWLVDNCIPNYRCCRCHRWITWMEIQRNLWGDCGFCNKCEILEQAEYGEYLATHGYGSTPQG